jgi:outer membrane receptor protein involved in Fe transport
MKPPIRFLPILTAWLAVMGSTNVAAFDAIDASLEDLLKIRILSTPKFAEDPDKIPSVVSILTADDIRTYGWRTVGDALRSLQGFNVTDDHTYTYAGTRGISPSGDYRARMQVLIDGVAINENIYGSAPIDSTFPLDIELIERIEVIRGPSASVYGGDALFGVINVVTRSGQSLTGPEIGLAYGSGKQRQARASWGGRLGNTHLTASFSGFDAAGNTLTFRDVDPSGTGQAVHGIGAEQGNRLFIQARGADWRFTLIHGQRERMVPHGSYGTILNDRGHTEADQFSAFDISKDWQLSQRTTLQQRLYANAYGYDGRFPYDYSPADPRVVNVDKARGNLWGIENRLVSTAWAGHRWTVGLEYQEHTRLNQLNYDVGYGCFGIDSAPCLDDRRRSHRFSLYAQDEMQVGTASTLSLGLRYDRQADFGSNWSPRLGFTHDAEAAGLFKVLYGTAFRIPTVYELAYITPTFVYGNPALDPEQMRSLEFSWEKRFSRAARLNAALYHFTIDRMIVPDASGVVANSKAVRATGLEVEYEYLWTNGIRLRTGFSIQDSQGESGRLDNSPRQMAKFNLMLPRLWQDISAGLEGQWVGSRVANDGSEKLKPYALVNLNLSYVAPGNKWDAGLGIYNLFDHRHDDPVSIDTFLPITRWYVPQVGRTLQLRTRIGF